MGTILLLEDDESLNRGISLKLQKEGYQVFGAKGVSEAKRFFAEHKVDLIISDITMPDGSGLEFCREIREKSDVFILFVTAMDQEVDIVNGYDIGADDYMTKPFSLMVLMSKVNAFMRRVERKEDADVSSTIISGNITVNCKEMKVYQVEEVVLSKKELQLLLYFLEYPQQIISKEQILESVWGTDGQFVDDNTVPVTISRLKRKLADGSEQECIRNVRGIGYIWTLEVLRR